jgi:hypothetical protein
MQVAGWGSWIGAVLSPREGNNASFRNDGKRWALPGEPIDGDDRLWRQYLVLVDLCKFYLEITWKVAVWYFATTGGSRRTSSATSRDRTLGRSYSSCCF